VEVWVEGSGLEGVAGVPDWVGRIAS